MNRREFLTGGLSVTIVGCGQENEVAQEYTIQSSPIKTGDPVRSIVPGYEEGEWIPSLGGNTTYFSTRNGYYTRIGKQVFVGFALVVDTLGTGSPFSISGLPFPVSNVGGNFGGNVIFSSGLATSTTSMALQFVANSLSVNVRSRTVASTSDGLVDVFTDNTSLVGSGNYLTA